MFHMLLLHLYSTGGPVHPPEMFLSYRGHPPDLPHDHPPPPPELVSAAQP